MAPKGDYSDAKLFCVHQKALESAWDLFTGGECGVVYNQRQRMPQQPGWDYPALNTNASGANLRLYYSFEYGERCHHDAACFNQMVDRS